MVLNICNRIRVRVPFDPSILVTWRVVAFAVAGGAWACQNIEIGGLFVHLALSCFREYFHTVAVLFQLL